MIQILRGTEAQRIDYGGLEVGRMMLCTDSLITWIGTVNGDVNTNNTASVIAEIFDGLDTAVIDGQGVYSRCDPWVGAEVGTGTAGVTVLAGADKMLTLTSGAPFAANYGSARLDFNINSQISAGIFKYKIRVSDVTKAFDGFQFSENGTTRFIIAMGNASFMRCRWGTGSWTNVVAIVNNTWYTVELHWNSSSQSLTVFVDDVWRGFFVLHNDSKCRYIDRLFTRAHDDNQTDNIDELEIVSFGTYPNLI